MVKYTLAKCKTKASYSAKLVQKGKLNLDAIKKQFTVKVDTPILLVISVDGIEVIVHGYGELLFKNSTDVELLEKLAKKIYEAGLQ
ncbi:MAG TPA: hypothetical protein VJI15_03465 [Candidatus Nanoarchaeia archaeon]|nr:hypothetical protein [Candidatus Nanoarchaeia archaeon]